MNVVRIESTNVYHLFVQKHYSIQLHIFKKYFLCILIFLRSSISLFLYSILILIKLF
jgi:hypothetical protein